MRGHGNDEVAAEELSRSGAGAEGGSPGEDDAGAGRSLGSRLATAPAADGDADERRTLRSRSTQPTGGRGKRRRSACG